MVLSSEDRSCFFEIWLGLLAFVNDKHKLVKDFGHPKAGGEVRIENVSPLRTKLWEAPGIIDEYLESVPDMGQEAVKTLVDWRNNNIAGDFVFVRQLKDYAVFLDAKREKLYGVLGISNPISDFCPSLPKMVKTVLLPFRGHIVYDTLLNHYSVSFGHNMRQSIHDQYMEIKRNDGIITTFEETSGRFPEAAQLPAAAAGTAPPSPGITKKTGKGPAGKEAIKEKQQQLLEMTGSFCREKLDEEYAHLCEALITKMGRKRTVPFASGQLTIWAAAVVHAVGTVNFLFDKSSETYFPLDEMTGYFGASKSTVGQKSKLIRDMFRMNCFNGEFLTRQNQKDNPLDDFIEVNGLLVPVSTLPEDVQEVVRKLRAEGKDVTLSTETRDD